MSVAQKRPSSRTAAPPLSKAAKKATKAKRVAASAVKSAAGRSLRPSVHPDALAPAKKGERLALRLTPETKQLLAMAASLGGTSVTEFVVASARRVAQERIEASAITKLSVEESLRFAEALLSPLKPNAKLKAAAKRYRELFQV